MKQGKLVMDGKDTQFTQITISCICVFATQTWDMFALEICIYTPFFSLF